MLVVGGCADKAANEMGVARKRGYNVVVGIRGYQDVHGGFPPTMAKLVEFCEAYDIAWINFNLLTTTAAKNSDWEYSMLQSTEVIDDRIIIVSKAEASQFGRVYCCGIAGEFVSLDSSSGRFEPGDWIDWEERVVFQDFRTYCNWRTTHLKGAATTGWGKAENQTTVRFANGFVATYRNRSDGFPTACFWSISGQGAPIVTERFFYDSRGRVSQITRTPNDWQATWLKWTPKED